MISVCIKGMAGAIESFLLTLGIGRVWRSQKNRPKFYTTDGKRVHHYQIGLLGLGGSAILYALGNKNSRQLAKVIAGFSAGLIVDDYQDLKREVLSRKSDFI